MRKFKLGYKLYRIYKGKPKSDLLDAINIRRRHSPYRGGSSLTISSKRLVKSKTKYTCRI